jgi:hypothetical protein
MKEEDRQPQQKRLVATATRGLEMMALAFFVLLIIVQALIAFGIL